MEKISELLQSLKEYLIGAYRELQKVVWPTKEETFRYSVAVITISAFIAIFFGIVDYIFKLILQVLI
ncbi:MAG: preprotein translocase subunit SecE [Candidatus Magasanikbacteria bacterium]